MGLAEIVQHSVQQWIDYEKHSVKYALGATVAGVIGGLTAGYYVATKYAANVIYTSLAAIGGYIASRFTVALPFHLKNI